MSLVSLLKTKETEKNVICLHSSNWMRVYHAKEHLGDDYFKTDKGVFRFKFFGFYGKSPLWVKTIGALPNGDDEK